MSLHPKLDDLLELRHQARALGVAANHLVNSTFSGLYASVFRGTGLDFDEVREYQPGDDVRTIDWNVTARNDEPYVKQFEEERELTVVLAADVSPSGRFGSGDRTKAETAAELCGVLAFAAVSNKDKVGLMPFTDRVEAYIPPRKGRGTCCAWCARSSSSSRGPPGPPGGPTTPRRCASRWTRSVTPKPKCPPRGGPRPRGSAFSSSRSRSCSVPRRRGPSASVS